MSENPWGRIAEDGSVFVRLPDGGEHQVGQWSAGDPTAGLQYYQRRFLDLLVEADLMEKRVAGGQANPDDTKAVADRLRAAVTDPSCVGDLRELTKRADELEQTAAKRRAALAGQKAMAKQAAAKEREEIVAEAEKLADSLSDKTQWKSAGQRFRDLLAQWQKIPRFDKGAEQELWKRFSKARSTFDKARKVHFAQLDEQRAEGARIKEGLIRRAEALSKSKDWGPTSRAYRELMDEWKAAPRASRERDDQLWGQFRAAQDVFFNARDEVNAERNAEESANLEKKQELVKQAEAILPVRDHKVARAKFRKILDQWDEIGHVPRAKRPALEGRLRKVEDAISGAEREHWKKSDPAGRARAQATVDAFTKAVTKLQKQHEVALAREDQRKADEIASSIAGKQALLDAANAALAEYSTN